ncbi:MAG: hypothetical protein P8Z30_10775 [Acidobacteriota bacterium]
MDFLGRESKLLLVLQTYHIAGLHSPSPWKRIIADRTHKNLSKWLKDKGRVVFGAKRGRKPGILFFKNKAGELLKTKDEPKKQTENKAETKLANLLKTIDTSKKQSGNKPENKAGHLVENTRSLGNKPKTKRKLPLRNGFQRYLPYEATTVYYRDWLVRDAPGFPGRPLTHSRFHCSGR